MEQIVDKLTTIKKQLRLAMNGVTSESMREKGLVYKVNFGVELPRIQEIAKSYEKDHHLAQALWKEDIREFKILAGLLQPIETFFPEIADIWAESIHNIEIAEMTAMNLFQYLPYAPAKSFQWIAGDNEYIQVCGFLTIARLLLKNGNMDERSAGEFLDQSVVSILSGSFHLRNSAILALRKFISANSENAFRACRAVDLFKNSGKLPEQMLYSIVKEEVEDLGLV